MNKASKELQDTKSLIEDLQSEISEKDNVIIEMYSLKEKDEENYKATIDQINEELKEKIRALEKTSQELQEKNRILDRMNEEIQEKNRTLDQVNEELLEKTRTIDQLNADVGTFKSEVEEHKGNVHQLEEKLRDVQEVNAGEIEKLRVEHQDELQALSSKHVAEFENLKLSMSEQLEESGLEVDKVRQEQIEKLKQIHESELNVLKETSDKQIAFNHNLEQQMKKMKEDFDNDLARARDVVAQKDAVVEDLKEQLKDMKTSSASEISELKNELKKKQKEIAELEDNLSSFEEEHSSDVAQYEQSMQKQQEQTAELEKQLVLELGNESAKYEQKLAETKAHLEAQYKKAIQELVQRVKDLESENETLQSTHGQEMEVFRENLAQYTSNLEEQMRELQSGAQEEHESEMKALQAEHLGATKKLERKVKTLSEEKEALETKIRSFSGEEGGGDSVGQSEEVARLKEDYEGQIQTLKEHAQNERERLEKEAVDAVSNKEKEFMEVLEKVLEKHQQEVADLRSYYEQQLSDTGEGRLAFGEEDDPLVISTQLKQEKEREISRLKKQFLQESEERIASAQEALLYKVAKEEEENTRLRNKLANKDQEISEVTSERDRLLNEIQVLTDTHRVLEQMTAPLEPSLSPVSSQVVQEEPLFVQESADTLEVLPGAGFNEGMEIFISLLSFMLRRKGIARNLMTSKSISVGNLSSINFWLIVKIKMLRRKHYAI